MVADIAAVLLASATDAERHEIFTVSAGVEILVAEFVLEVVAELEQ